MNGQVTHNRPPAPGIPAPTQRFRLGYRSSLDGLRGLAILAVFISHTEVVPGRAAPVGVAIFFALSGFLITSLLLEEWDQFHSIDLQAFYIRRAL
ncbi:MAG TPA: acyltransferase family protein, partial [Clostridia bacterium]|nr:acyltransferase family protein [Clostridia bacterium]